MDNRKQKHESKPKGENSVGSHSSRKNEQDQAKKRQEQKAKLGALLKAHKKKRNRQNRAKRLAKLKLSEGSGSDKSCSSMKRNHPSDSERGQGKSLPKVRNNSPETTISEEPPRKKAKTEFKFQPYVPLVEVAPANPNFRKILQKMQKFNPAAGFTMFTCRTIKIGTFKIPPILGVILQPTGLLFQILHNRTKEPTLCGVPAEHMVSVRAHLSPRLPVLFIETSPSCAAWLRKRLGLSEVPGEPTFFCPVQGGPTERLIILFPIQFSFRLSSANMKKILVPLGLVEVDFRKANEILLDSTPDPDPDSFVTSSKVSVSTQPSTSTRNVSHVVSSSDLTSTVTRSNEMVGYWWNNEWKWKTK